jgi:hypothetical protein
MNRPLTLLLFTIVVSCSVDDVVVYQVDPRLEHYVGKFFEEGRQRGKNFPKNNLIIKVTRNLLATENRLAVNRGTEGKQILIEIDEGFVSNNDSLYIEYAMMHEFGHGFLKREHTLSYSIMNPVRKSLSGYRKNPQERNRLLDELFK